MYCDAARFLGLSSSVPPLESRLTCTSKLVPHLTSVQSSATCFVFTVEPLAGETRVGRIGFAEHAAAVGVFVGVTVGVGVAAGGGVGVAVGVPAGGGAAPAISRRLSIQNEEPWP